MSELPEECLGQLACWRTLPKFQLEKKRLLSFYVLHGRLVFLILIFFLRTWERLPSWSLFPVTHHPTLRHLSGVCDAMFGQNSVLTHFLVPLPSCSLQRESSQNKFWVQVSLPLALEKGYLICKITLKLSGEALQFWTFLIANTHSFPNAKKGDLFWPVYPK